MITITQIEEISETNLAALIVRVLKRNAQTRPSQLHIQYDAASLSGILDHELLSPDLNAEQVKSLQAKYWKARDYLRDQGFIRTLTDGDADLVSLTPMGWAADVRIIPQVDQPMVEADSVSIEDIRHSESRAVSVVGFRTLGGELVWGSGIDNHPDADISLRIRLELLSPEPHDSARVVGAARRLISESEVEWLKPGGEVWLVDLGVLRNDLSNLRTVSWLSGKVAVAPQVHSERLQLIAGYTRGLELALAVDVYKASIELYITPNSTAPLLKASEILSEVFVLESEERCTQGTAFNLEGIGLVTCEHALAPDVMAFRPASPTLKYPVEVVSSNRALDIARIESPIAGLGAGLPIGTADDLDTGDIVWVCGFPNYNVGDSGILAQGRIIGFRPVSGIARLLVDAPIVAGNSGGPLLNAKGQVVGVAVTGADRMENVQDTEKHGAVPIDALRYLVID